MTNDEFGGSRGNRGRVTCPHVTGGESDVSREMVKMTGEVVLPTAWWNIERSVSGCRAEPINPAGRFV